MPEFPLRDNSWIKIRGARQHNLKNIDVDLPRHQLVVITGVSGSGKSSLAFDTLYAEGQRRYMQSLSVYARQFLDQLDKPDVDSIEGLSPAIAVEQRNASPNPRSTIATATEIHDFLRVLFSAVGVPHDPVTGVPLRRKTPMEIARHGLQYPEGSRLLILAPASERDLLDGEASWSRWKREGFLRVRLDGEIVDMEEKPPVALTKEHRVEVVVDRLVLREGMQSRLVESIDAALKLGGGRVSLAAQAPGDAPPVEELHTTALENPATGYRMETPTPQWFSFNSHFGACPVCQGLGTGLVPDETLLVPDPEKSLADGAVKTWWARPKSIKALLEKEVEGLARHFGVSMDLPFGLLPETFRNALFHGTGREPVSLDWQAKPGKRLLAKPFEGLLPRTERLFRESESELGRAALRRFMKPVPCEACHGARLRPESLAVRLESRGEKKNLHEFTALSVAEARVWLAGLDLTPDQRHLCRDLIIELESRLRFLEETGVPYLTLQRTTGSLSGGEAQRIRLATQIGAGLSGVLYVLDEPSIGLHQSDNERLLATLEKLRDLGNTVVVVEHDPETMRKADWLIDIGPGAGPLGGELVASGTPAEVMADERSVTGSYLAGRRFIPVPAKRCSPSRGASLLKEEGDGWLRVEGASAHNLKNIDVAVPVGCLTCVTGVSGSGKSTLVDDIIRPAVLRAFGQTSEAPGVHKRVTGIKQFDKIIVIDQAPIGRSPRSNPATYMGLFQQIRTLFTKLPLARMRGYQAGRFSFNVAGGRCPKCEGDGMLKIDMHFLPEAWVPCAECGGKRYNRETLEVTYQGRSVADVLEMDVDEALSFFQKVPQITDFLTPLHDVGLGYVKLGQSATTFSGGEAQRIKLAAELARKSTGRTLYLFDEPTTGLHFQDVELLMGVLFRLRDAGNTLVVVEHNLDVIKGADWIIDLGPGGGTNGGHVVAKGTPEEVAKEKGSLTGHYLKTYLVP